MRLSDEAVKAALKVWFGRDQDYGRGQEIVMREAIHAAMEVDRGASCDGVHGPPPCGPSGVSLNPRTGTR